MWKHWHKPEWRMTRALALGAMLLTSMPWALSAADWALRSKSGAAVQLWTDDSRTPFRHVRAETVIAAPILPLLELLQDPASQPHWLPYTHQVEILQQTAPEQTLVRFETQARWPFAARDAVTLFQVSQPDASTIRIDMLNRPDAIPPHAGIERIRQAEGHWQLQALDQCRTQVRYEAGNRWGGNVPQWLVDRMNAQLAQEALQNLRKWAPDHYRDYSRPEHSRPEHSRPDYLQKVELHAHCD